MVATTDKLLEYTILNFGQNVYLKTKILKTEGDLTINSPNNLITFSGAGTIVVNGNLLVNPRVDCSQTTRLAFIVSGSITFGNSRIGCGAYLSLNESITLADDHDGDITGIFIAKKNINLPIKTLLTATYSIKYDTYLAGHPTALLQETLNVVFSTSS